MMCGNPCSGKTMGTNKLQDFFENVKNHNVHIIRDSDFATNKNALYKDSQKEKIIRGNLKAATQRKISKDDVLILDSGNYIKGYRYELYCVSKSAQTPQCVIYYDTDPELSIQWNKTRPEHEQYTPDVLTELVQRFEPPQSNNRWDSPLFVVKSGEALPFEDIYNALFLRKAPPPNFSTLSQPLSATNFLHELDRITQQVISDVMTAQATAVPGDTITIPGAKDKIHYTRTLTLAELQRTRRQFISFNKTHPVEDSNCLPNMFVQFLNTSIK